MLAERTLNLSICELIIQQTCCACIDGQWENAVRNGSATVTTKLDGSMRFMPEVMPDE